ncbi:YopT-type cysteine protease domain-containing protein [Paraburkholderia sp. JHI869]|uniref:YopT-type cysteine protease domain-containing protein n=1 Tax=Paraburkholderia sp. JHI869 TaxID=3112959 RepID=UPI00317D80CA
MARDFRALNRYAHREYKFVQRDSYAQVRARYRADMADGVCMGVVLNWVKEKLSTSNGLRRVEGPLRNPTVQQFSNPLNPLTRIRQGISPPTHSLLGKLMGKQPGQPHSRKSGPRNENTMLDGAHTQANYRYKSRDDLVSDLGLVPGKHVPKEKMRQEQFAEKNARTGYTAQRIIAVRADDEMLAEAGENLPKGNAIVLDLKQEAGGPGHAVAFYKSRGGTLYFFDPNAGVYEISRPYSKYALPFMRAWLEVYTNDTDGDGNATPRIWKAKDGDRWYSVFNRTKS